MNQERISTNLNNNQLDAVSRKFSEIFIHETLESS